jgi:hypothetical protein
MISFPKLFALSKQILVSLQSNCDFKFQTGVRSRRSVEKTPAILKILFVPGISRGGAKQICKLVHKSIRDFNVWDARVEIIVLRCSQTKKIEKMVFDV